MEEINNEKLQRFSLAVNTEIDHQVDEIIREAEKKSRDPYQNINHGFQTNTAIFLNRVTVFLSEDHLFSLSK